MFSHCRNVHAVARALLAYLPEWLREKVKEPALLCAALHDVGKASPGFQKKYFHRMLERINPRLAALSNAGFETNHAVISQSAINAYLGAGGDHLPAALVAGIHHGALSQREMLNDMAGGFGGRAWAVARRKLMDALTTACNLGKTSPFPDRLWPVIAGLVSTADWIGSDEAFFPSDDGIDDPDGLAAAADTAVRACGWSRLPLVKDLGFEQVFGFPPYPAQREFVETVTGPGIYVMEAPMGMGKTEAALFAAYRLMAGGHNRGLYFGLPTRLTSDKIHDRVALFLDVICDGPVPLQLAHGNAWMRHFRHGKTNRDEGEGGLWFSPRKRSLLSPFAVGTIDQALLSVLRVKHFFVRAFGLAGKVVILDEVHSYDGYTGTIMDTMIRGLLDWGCTVIILSATLTRVRRSELLGVSMPERRPDPEISEDPYPLVSWRQTDSFAGDMALETPPSRHYHLHLKEWNDAEVAREAAQKARAGQCVLCIANSVARAQSWHSALAAERNDEEFELGLMHARFPAFARDELEDRWIRRLGKEGPRPRGCVLVATQVVEQSVDIDADVLITELCPTDMLLQRMGRQWRHPRPRRPCHRAETHILTGAVDSAESPEDIVEALGHTNSLIYAPYVLWRSYRVWSERSVVRLPGDIRSLLEETYDEPERESALAAELHHQLRVMVDKLKHLARSAAATVSSLPVMSDLEDVATRYSDLPMVDVLPVAQMTSQGNRASVTLLDGGTYELEADMKKPCILARLHANLLSMPRYRLQKLGDLRMPPWLAGVFYEPTPVLLWADGDGSLTLDGRPTGYTYDDVRGLRWRIDTEATHEPSLSGGEEFSDMDVFDKTRFDW